MKRFSPRVLFWSCVLAGCILAAELIYVFNAKPAAIRQSSVPAGTTLQVIPDPERPPAATPTPAPKAASRRDRGRDMGMIVVAVIVGGWLAINLIEFLYGLVVGLVAFFVDDVKRHLSH